MNKMFLRWTVLLAGLVLVFWTFIDPTKDSLFIGLFLMFCAWPYDNK